MNPLDRLLADDLNALLDRVASAGAREPLPEGHPLRARLDEVEHRLGALRLGLLARYEDWRGALSECEDLWSLAALVTGDTAPAAEDRRAA